VLEKHITYNPMAHGPDHAASLSPDEFTEMVSAVRDIEQALGSGVKECCPEEYNTRKVARRSIVAASPIKAGEVLTTENLICKRPAGGLSPMKMGCLLGKAARHDYAEDQFIQPDEIS
jgi:N,N'-diacetyllegionaminate synthase